ncbi:Uma2 family endonuclease [Hymenobacter siberiensis]|uniref:Uma2 family endonuclease n=1 Tax=Hymenobacter siberiensis TaxID=2848396 RepID=UPI001C1E7E1D|nr:Uma2 family endonuclease [Hymenobacter siberiensis]MBU6122789.1 Uma2 family endonuclease [Hymenobacter siberiensis]
MSAARSQPEPPVVPPKTWYSPEEYLAFDNAAEGRFEYADGRITPVGAPEIVNVLDPTFRAGASPAHYELSRVVSGLLFNRLPASCRAYSSDARVYIPITRAYAYPDVVIVCGKPEYHDPDAALPSLLNPRVLIEILSDSTADYDRIDKFMRYRSIESLQEYVLIDPRTVTVELFTRQESGGWNYSPANDLQEKLTLASVGCTLALAELYAGLLPTVAA